MMLLPPAKGLCQDCAVKHDPAQPHDRDSIFYGTKFAMNNEGAAPTWHDAMAHCSEEVKAMWVKALSDKGVKL